MTLRPAVAILLTTVVASSSLPADDAVSAVQRIDLSDQVSRQVTVDREQGQYLGHPTTLLLEDGRTILCVYPKGHGKGGIVYKRSTDGGRTWSQRLDTPANWSTSREVPTLHRVIDADGRRRVIMFSGLYPIRMAVSEDDGLTWSELNPIGDFGGIVAMGCVFPVRESPGEYVAMFHDDGRFISADAKQKKPVVFTLYQTRSSDGGLTWSPPQSIIASSEYHLCEPGVIRSPDQKEIAVLLRENSRRHNSQIIFSQDEGKTWSSPVPLPDALSGDRHTGQYSPDGRILISFRKRSASQRPDSEFEGDWVAWVGSWFDLKSQVPGQYLVRLKDNHRGADCAYPGVEVLPDGTFVITTYGHWNPGEQPWILSVRLRLSELDAMAD